MTGRLSIIIPTINEESLIGATLDALLSHDIAETILADGGSTDRTTEIAQQAGCRVIDCPHRGRGRQMNAGAAAARGDILLFLHADTRMPPSFVNDIRRTMCDPEVVLGAFSLGIESATVFLKIIAHFANLRARWCRLPYGDQAFFIRRDLFLRIGGFPEVEIMEDYIFARNIQHWGKTVILDTKVSTSSRRWQNLGPLRTTLCNQMIVIGHWCGVRPATLAHWYQRLRGLTPSSRD